MEKALADVAAFHRACDVPIGKRPQNISIERRALRVSLMDEEFRELLHAMADADLIEIADACADLIYVVIGTALEYGIPLDRVWTEVQRSNMAKIGSSGKVSRREDGKILKPEGWSPPDIATAINVT